jgi:hypothetical protein
MKLSEFWQHLAETRNGWKVFPTSGRVSDGSIRKAKSGLYSPDCRCPVTAVCEKVTGAKYIEEDYPLAAQKMGLRRNVAEQIADAADHSVLFFETYFEGRDGKRAIRYRQKLLKILGLEEVK